MRNLTLSPEQVARVLELVRDGHFISTAEKAIGVSRNVVWQQVHAGETEGASPVLREFAAAFRAAEAAAEDVLLATVKAGAKDPDWKASAWVMERRWPKRWAGRSDEHREKDEPEAARKKLDKDEARELARKSRLHAVQGGKP